MGRLAGSFSYFGGFKLLIGMILLICLIVPSVAPMVIRAVSSNTEAMVERYRPHK